MANFPKLRILAQLFTIFLEDGSQRSVALKVKNSPSHQREWGRYSVSFFLEEEVFRRTSDQRVNLLLPVSSSSSETDQQNDVTLLFSYHLLSKMQSKKCARIKRYLHLNIKEQNYYHKNKWLEKILIQAQIQFSTKKLINQKILELKDHHQFT